jgi:hypothetical protein
MSEKYIHGNNIGTSLVRKHIFIMKEANIMINYLQYSQRHTMINHCDRHITLNHLLLKKWEANCVLNRWIRLNLHR